MTSKPSRTLSAAILCALAAILLTPVARAATVQDFDNPGTPYTAVGTATVVGGGPTGSFLRLTPSVDNQNGRVAFDLGDAGAPAVGIEGQFDFRAIPGADSGGDGQADGIGFMVLPTSIHGTTGDYAVIGNPELARAAGAFGISLNIHQAGDPEPEISNNSIILSFNGATVAEVAAPFDISTDQFHRANFSIDFQQGGGANVSVSLIQDSLGIPQTEQAVYTDFNIPGFDPFEYRIGVQARTGGQNADQQIDNINVVTSVPEPSSFVLAGLGLLGVVGIWRKTRRR